MKRREWPAAAKLSAFAVVLALSFGVGAAVGARVGPEGSPSVPAVQPDEMIEDVDPSMPHGDDGHGG